MEKGYFPIRLIKFQVDTNKTDLSYLTNKNKKMGHREYIIRKFSEKPRKEYRYVKPHPSTRYRKETNTAEKTNIEPIKTNIEPIKTNIEPIKTNIEPIKTNIEPIKTNIEPIKTNIETKANNQKTLAE